MSAANEVVIEEVSERRSLSFRALEPLVQELADVWKYRYVVYSFVYTNVKIRYRRSYLGFLWTILAPLLHYAVIGVMMSMLLKNRMENFYAYYFSGAVFFSVINGVVGRAPFVMIQNEHFIKKIYLPKIIFLLNVVCYELTNFVLSSTALIGIGILSGAFHFHLTIPLAFLALVFLALFLLGVSSILSVVAVYFRDFTYITPVLLQAAFFVTPIAFNAEMLPEKARWLIWWNPLYYFLEMFRLPLVYGEVPAAKFYLVAGGLSLSMLMIGLLVLKKFDNRIVFKL